MSALTFDPWAPAKTQFGDMPPANPANPRAETAERLAELAGLATASREETKLAIPRPSNALNRASRRWSYPWDDPALGDWCGCCRGRRF